MSGGQAIPNFELDDEEPWDPFAADFEDPTPRRRPLVAATRDPDRPSTWREVDLTSIIDGTAEDARPAIGARSDGACLIYAGKLHLFISETEGGKTWLALQVIRGELAAGRHAFLVDFEDSAAGIISRLADLGVDPELVTSRFHYIRPDEPMDLEAALAYRDALEEHRPSVVVVDGTTGAMALEGLSGNANDDVASWHRQIAGPAVAVGAAVILLDHIPKNVETRGRFALGSQHKLAGLDGACFKLEVVKSFGRGRDGLVRVHISKDRPGHLRGIEGPNHAIADMALTCDPDGGIRIDLEPPTEGDFRPTTLMERISVALAGGVELSTTELINGVTGKKNAKAFALRLLVDEGFVAQREDGPRKMHKLVRPFRAGDDAPEKDA